MGYQQPDFQFKIANKGRHAQFLFGPGHYFIPLWNSLSVTQQEVYNKLASPHGQSGFILAFLMNIRLSMIAKVHRKYLAGNITREKALWMYPQLESII